MVLFKQFVSRLRAENLLSEVGDDTGNAKRDTDKTIYAFGQQLFSAPKRVCVLGGGATAPAAPSSMYIPIFLFSELIEKQN